MGAPMGAPMGASIRMSGLGSMPEPPQLIHDPNGPRLKPKSASSIIVGGPFDYPDSIGPDSWSSQSSKRPLGHNEYLSIPGVQRSSVPEQYMGGSRLSSTSSEDFS